MLEDTTGTKVFIGPATTSDDVETYEALTTYVEVKLVESFGEIGDESSVITFNSLSDGRVRKRKGLRDSGTTTINCGVDRDDPGQTAMIAAEKSKARYAFKITTPDPDGVGSATETYFGALVTSARTNRGANNAVVMRSFGLALDTEVIDVVD